MSEKTEEPTPKKLRDARKKGQVPNSKDVTSTALLIVIFTYLWFASSNIFDSLIDYIIAPAKLYTQPFEKATETLIITGLLLAIKIILPLLLLVAITGVIGHVFQFGLLLAVESIQPNFSKLNPISKIQQIFSLKNLMEFLKSAGKIIFLGFLLYFVIRDALDPLLKVPFIGLSGFFKLMPEILKKFAYNVIFAYVVVAFLDFIFQRRNHIKQLMMTKDEVKREYKEMEGDPTVKSKRKQLQRELLQGGPIQKTKKSSALITNPTHYAIAIYYDEIIVPLPVVLAKGTGLQAQLMKKAAMDFDIPIMENVPLAHALYDLADVGKYIPRELIEPVAEVLVWVKEQKESRQRAGFLD